MVIMGSPITFLDKIEKILALISDWMFWISVGGFIVMMTMTFIDVVMRYTLSMPIYGGYDITQVIFCVTVASAFSYTQLRKGHIVIDVFTSSMPKKARTVLDSYVYLVLFVLFILISWQVFKLATGVFTTGDATGTTHIPFWPFFYYVGLNCVLVTLIILTQTIRLFTEARKK